MLFSGERRLLACTFRQLAEKTEDTRDFKKTMTPTSCRLKQAGSLRSPDSILALQ
jgi:hypothetical protein